MDKEEIRKLIRNTTIAFLRRHVLSVKTDFDKPFGKEFMLGKLCQEIDGIELN